MLLLIDLSWLQEIVFKILKMGCKYGIDLLVSRGKNHLKESLSGGR